MLQDVEIDSADGGCCCEHVGEGMHHCELQVDVLVILQSSLQTIYRSLLLVVLLYNKANRDLHYA
jgi:hypothetical protein